MKDKLEIKVYRFNPERDRLPQLIKYKVPGEKGGTVLGALLYIYEEIDSTLAFSYSCRHKRCGLCGVEVNGLPKLACLSPLRDQMEITPLKKLPLIRDLMIDRSSFLSKLKFYQLYLPPRTERKELEIIHLSKELKALTACVECLGCNSSCPYYSFEDKNFAGPFIFVKMAQLNFHPRNEINRVTQAKNWGIEICRKCGKCRCTLGIPIYQEAILPLLRG